MIINARNIPINSNKKIYRCGFLVPLDQSVYEWAKRKNIKKIICLSDDLYVENKDCLEQEICCVPFSGPKITERNCSTTDYFNAYCNMIHENGIQTAVFIENILNDEDNILFGCTFGKDRTGILAAIILRLYGISDEVITRDYNESICWLRENSYLLCEHWKKHGLSYEQYMKRFEIEPQIIISTLNYIDRIYGSVKKYLEYNGYSFPD